ncbi:MAG: 23S rRNA (adenine(2503)-C(2))-methyltransferase RlmN [bacterium]|nr:23S rRNA (adenine(2503)-C(2))-methyltransferase RlmN [bacterium]
MTRQNLLGYTLPQLVQAMERLGERPFRARQLHKWLYLSRQYDFSLMTDFSKQLRSQLEENYQFTPLQLEYSARSKDGTEKYLFRLPDGRPVETVLIPDDYRRTLCISSQSGCPLGCRFCATGTLGLLRNLTVGEIVGQLMYVRDLHGDEAFTNVVFMGMGEPMHNYDTVMEAIGIMTDPIGLKVSARKITISTSGVTPKIKKLADSGSKARLALSLHAATQEKRLRIMPIAETFGLDKLMEAIRYYTETTGQRVTFEYILFDGFNDTLDDVKALGNLVRGIPCKINVLAYNEVPGLDFKRPSDDKVDWFGRMLQPRTPAVTVRKSRGRDIDAACGQLAARQSK